MLLAVSISSYGCTWEVWRTLKKLKFLSAAPRATLTHFSFSPNFPRASTTRYTHAKHEQILKFSIYNMHFVLQKVYINREERENNVERFETLRLNSTVTCN